MFTWLPSSVESCRRNAGCLARLAVRQSAHPVAVELRLHAEPPVAPVLVVTPDVPCRLDALPDGVFRVTLTVPPPADPHSDDEVTLDLTDAGGSPACRVVLRRSTCEIHVGLLGDLDAMARERWPQTEAGLRWFGWRRFRELVGIKCFTSGRSGTDVLVFRPRLRAPDTGTNRHLATSYPGGAVDGDWGTLLLVKSGEEGDVTQEWVRFQTYLRDRLHPFLVRTEELLTVRPAGGGPGGEPVSTLVSTFLGGDLVRAETLEDVIRGADDFTACRPALDRCLDLLAPWHAAARPDDLGRWRRVFHPGPAGEADWLLFGKFDFTRKETVRPRRGTDKYVSGLLWDVNFIRSAHLHHHLLGRPDEAAPADPKDYGLPGPRRDGLFGDLMRVRARFGLTHGDLNPRNVLCQGDNAWLIDFEHTGVAPALADYAWLEANLRLWCLTLAPGGDDVAGAAERFERYLLDHFHGSEGGLGRVRDLAAGLGAAPHELAKLARCIVHVRTRAARHCVEDYADRRDYLAVLFLTCLSLMQYAGEGVPPANYRLLTGTAWVLEEMLCRLLGRPPFARRRADLDPALLLTRDWILDDGAPGRVAYLLDRPDGRRALGVLAACRGVVQNDHHHLDILDHTLLVLANLEALLADPVRGLLDPASIDESAASALARQGLHPPPVPSSSRAAEAHVTAMPADLGVWLRSVTEDRENGLLLKWLAVLHDVGKSGTRGVNDGKVQFIGHEVYGRQLVAPLLQTLFPEGGLRCRLERLILAHHVFHQVATHYAKEADDFAALTAGLARGEIPRGQGRLLGKYVDPARDEYHADFALLVLHGYADRLAGRGRPLGNTAEVARAMLAFAFVCDAGQ
jgi:hypothetical protein